MAPSTIPRDMWENKLLDFYRCGGDPFSDGTKVIIGLKMLPQGTPSSVMMALRTIRCFESFKDELRTNIRFPRGLRLVARPLTHG